jgi:hypothetical protein
LSPYLMPGKSKGKKRRCSKRWGRYITASHPSGAYDWDGRGMPQGPELDLMVEGLNIIVAEEH